MEDTNDFSLMPVLINGALMNSYLQQKAIIVGFVTKIDPDGKRATLKATDDEYIQLIFTYPVTYMFSFSIRPNQLVEAYGIVTNRSQFQCLNLSHFSLEESEKFDSWEHNKSIRYFIERYNRNMFEMEEEEILQNLDNDFEVYWKNGAENSTTMNDSIAAANSNKKNPCFSFWCFNIFLIKTFIPVLLSPISFFFILFTDGFSFGFAKSNKEHK